MSCAWDKIDNKYNSFAHIYCSAHPSIFSHIVLLLVCKIFFCCNSCNRCLLCAAVVAAYFYYYPADTNETLMSWIFWKHWNYLMWCLQQIATIVFRLNLLYKTGYNYFSIITPSQDVMIFSSAFKILTVLFAAVVCPHNKHTQKIECQFMYTWSVVFLMKFWYRGLK